MPETFEEQSPAADAPSVSFLATATRRRFALSAGGIILLFLVLEIVYAFRLPRVMDEFNTAHDVYRVSHLVPYRDFPPPKTVIGYYVELLPIAVIRGGWDAMTGVKIELAILWAAALAMTAIVLGRDLGARSVLGALALTAVMSTFAERATEVRVDPVAAMFGLASLFALIRRRPALAGILCAASFLSTQKGIYFALSGGLALVAMAARDRTRESAAAVVRYGIASATTVAGYLLFWSALSSPSAVFGRGLVDANIRAIALEDIYAGIRGQFWTQTLSRNPFFYALGFIGLVLLVPRWKRRSLKLEVVVPYAFVLSVLCVWHKQPWPYFFVFLVPTLGVVIALALDQLPFNRTLFAVMIAGGILIPLMRLPITLTREVTAYQEAMVKAGEQLLEPGETYLDGTNLLYRNEQATPEFVWLDAPTLGSIVRSSDAELKAMVSRIELGRPKLVMWSYRMAGLPFLMQIYLRSSFLQLFGDVLIYAPTIRPPEFSVAFDGTYRFQQPVLVDGLAVRDLVTLKRGMHTIEGMTMTRIELLPSAGLKVDLQFARPRPLFDNPYGY